jgi:hypothetical protein
MKLKRWEYGLIVGIVLLLSGIAYAQLCRSEKLTIGATPTALTAATYGRATYAFATLETAQIRWTIDPNITVTTTLGLVLETGQNITLDSPYKIRNFRGIRTGGTSGVLQILYFE